jgi:hypothetical protein
MVIFQNYHLCFSIGRNRKRDHLHDVAQIAKQCTINLQQQNRAMHNQNNKQRSRWKKEVNHMVATSEKDLLDCVITKQGLKNESKSRDSIGQSGQVEHDTRQSLP